MNKPKWTMKWQPNSDHTLSLNIIDNHNHEAILEKWTAHNEGELLKHLKELKTSIDFGTYTDYAFCFENHHIATWDEFSHQSRNYFHQMMIRSAA